MLPINVFARKRNISELDPLQILENMSKVNTVTLLNLIDLVKEKHIITEILKLFTSFFSRKS